MSKLCLHLQFLLYDQYIDIYLYLRSKYIDRSSIFILKKYNKIKKFLKRLILNQKEKKRKLNKDDLIIIIIKKTPK